MIKNKIDLDYGLDELLLKMLLLPDIFVYEIKIDNYIKCLFINDVEEKCFNNIHKLTNTQDSYLEDSNGNKVIIDNRFYRNMINKYPRFFTTSWLYQMDHYDSRQLFIKQNNIKLDIRDDIYINVNLFNICWTTIFIGYNENKKLLLLDKNLHFKLNRNETIETLELDKKYNIIYIQDYKLSEMNGILNIL